MHRRGFGCLALFVLIFCISGPAFSQSVLYTDRAAWQAAVAAQSITTNTFDFEGIASAGGFVRYPTGFTLDGVTFSLAPGQQTGGITNFAVAVVDGTTPGVSAWGSGAMLWFGIPNTGPLTAFASLPAGNRAVGADYGATLCAVAPSSCTQSSPANVLLSTGETFTIPGSPSPPSLRFVGVVSSVPIQWIQISGMPSFNLLDNFTFGPATPPCPAPPQSIFTDTVQAVGLADAVVTNQTIARCSTTADVRVDNFLRLWLGVGLGVPPTASFSPNLNAGIQGQQALAGLLPPCHSTVLGNPFACKTPGSAAWTASFSQPGTTTLTIGVTPNAMGISIVDRLAPGQSVATLTSLAAQLDTVRDYQAAVNCYRIPSTAIATHPVQAAVAAAGCASAALLRLSSNVREVQQIQRIASSVGITLSVRQIFNRLTGASIGAIEDIGDLIVFFVQTTAAGHPGVLTFDVDSR
jgi:hypothetical protein